MTSVYCSSMSFGSRVRSKYIGHNTYTVKKIISAQNQHQFVEQLTNMIWIIHTQEVTLVDYRKQLLRK